MFILEAAPGRKFSTTTSAAAASCCTSRWPASVFMLTAIDLWTQRASRTRQSKRQQCKCCSSAHTGTPLIPVHGQKVGALLDATGARDERRPPQPRVIAGTRHFDLRTSQRSALARTRRCASRHLDDVCAPVAKQHRAERAGEHAGQIKHSDAFQGGGSCSGHESDTTGGESQFKGSCRSVLKRIQQAASG